MLSKKNIELEYAAYGMSRDARVLANAARHNPHDMMAVEDFVEETELLLKSIREAINAYS
jgi:hypothetical protein